MHFKFVVCASTGMAVALLFLTKQSACSKLTSMKESHQNNLNRLAERWQDICSAGAKSLAVDRKWPRCPSLVLSDFEMLSPKKREMLADHFTTMIETMDCHFPENIYWDIDAMIHSLVKRSVDESESVTLIRLEKIIDLMKIFGKDGVIRFQYFHDFTFGFDWVKWFQKTSPKTVDESDPFACDFLDYMLKRGKELIVSIANNDEKYPKLPADGYRNSYPFDRRPESERRGLALLRDHDAIPLKVWIAEAKISYRMDYLQIRESILAKGAIS